MKSLLTIILLNILILSLIDTSFTTDTLQIRTTPTQPLPIFDTVHVHSSNIDGSFLMDKKDIEVLIKESGCRRPRSLCTLSKQYQCRLCRQDNCLTGIMHFKRGAVQGENQKGTELRMYTEVANYYLERAHVKVKTQSRQHTFDSLYFKCEFDSEIPLGESFSLGIPWRIRSDEPMLVVSESLTREPKPRVIPNSVAVCGRGLYGDITSETISKQVEYYQYQNIGPLIIYDIGLGYFNDRRRLDRYIKQGTLIMVDLRDSLLQRYGSAADYVLLQTFAAGQMWLKTDCMIRARKLGYEWALHVDIDEYVFPGVEGNLKLNDIFMAHMHDDISWMSIGSLHNPQDRTICDEIPLHKNLGRFSWDWDQVIDTSMEIHKTEQKTPEKYFNVDQCDNFRLCEGAGGLRKLLAKTTMDHNLLNVHRVSLTIQKQGVVLSTDSAYIRHHRCANVSPDGRRHAKYAIQMQQ